MILTLAAWVITASFATGSLARDMAAEAMSFTRDLRTDTRTGRPLVVMFSRRDCGYCRRLETEQFVPLLRSGEYAERIVIRKLSLDAGQRVIDMSGIDVDTGKIADRYGVDVTPTVLLLGPQGQELAEPLVGMGLPDFYWAYLQRAIREAEDRLDELDAEATDATEARSAAGTGRI